MKTLDYSSPEYLPDSFRRIAHLQKIINHRSVVILAAGPSIAQLEKEIDRLHDIDVCYFGFNNYSVQENHILSKINKKISVMMCSAKEAMPNEIGNITKFLDRKEDGVFISSFWRDTFELMPKDFKLKRFLKKYDSKLLFFSLDRKRDVPNFHKPLHFIVGNSLLALIQLAIIGKAKNIIIFGGDGYSSNGKRQHYRSKEYHPEEPFSISHRILVRDTNQHFNPSLPWALRNLYKVYQQKPIPVLNCSPGSQYTSLPIISYPDAIGILQGKKQYKPGMDCRIPKVTIIVNQRKNSHFSETKRSILAQTYEKCEFIYSEDISKSIEMAQGKFIFICPSGTGFLDKNWVAMCVEVLENHPDISLVWALRQQKFSDGALGKVESSKLLRQKPLSGKNFIYSWLINPIIFYGPSFCIRKEVFQKCLPYDSENFWENFSYNFVTHGFLAYFFPIVVSYFHPDPDTLSSQLVKYYQRVRNFRERLWQNPKIYRFRNGNSLLDRKYGFNRQVFVWFHIRQWLGWYLQEHPGLWPLADHLTKIFSTLKDIIQRLFNYCSTFIWLTRQKFQL